MRWYEVDRHLPNSFSAYTIPYSELSWFIVKAVDYA